ncbi:MAG: ankyrin repeat domain-containing protein [Verrucomicrobiota bacterium]
MSGIQRILSGGAVIALSMAALTSCKKPKDAVKSDLGEAGYKITTTDWFRATRSNDAPALKKFVASGFAVDTRDEAGDSALHAAATTGARDSAEFLLNHKLPVDLRGASERTPLMAAVLSDQTAMVRWLLRQGANPKLKDKEGYEPLMLAVRAGKPGPVRELAPHRRDSLDSAILLAAMEGHTEVIDTLTNYGASVYARMDDGRTPLMIAAENGHTDTVKLLLDIGAGRLATDAQGRTAADLATTASHPEIATLISHEPKPGELSLESPEEVSKKMDAFVDAAVAKSPTPEDVVDHPPTAKGPSKPIQNELLSASVTLKPAPTKPGDPTTAAANDSFPVPPLVMRHYRESELPIEVRTVTGDTASLMLKSTSPHELKVRQGETIPGTRLMVVKVQHRMKSSKLNEGKPMDVSVVEVRDTTTGTTREWISGMPSSAHDPIALIEDSATGHRYTATPGQKFKSADGATFIISDVRPNQIIIEDTASGAVQTIPLRGPRG